MDKQPFSHLSGKLITAIICCFLSGFNPLSATPDSLRVVSNNGSKFIEHKVEPKETLSGLSRRYKVSVQDLQSANPGIRVLQIGQMVKVPVAFSEGGRKVNATGEEKSIADPVKPLPSAKPQTSFRHTVLKGETLYSISQRHGLSVDELKSMNGLKSNDLKTGQQLIIKRPDSVSSVNSDTGAESGVKETTGLPVPAPSKSDVKDGVRDESRRNEVPAVSASASAATVSKVGDEIKSTGNDTVTAVLPSAYDAPGASRTSKIEKDPKTGVVIEKITEVGVASWLESGELNQNKFYCLHRTAPVGTIIKIINRMNNNSVFVKVVGVLPDTGDNANVIVKLTQAAAQRIGALDARFTAELNYGLSR